VDDPDAAIQFGQGDTDRAGRHQGMDQILGRGQSPGALAASLCAVTPRAAARDVAWGTAVVLCNVRDYQMTT
jgi:hypothetical protein